MHDMKRASVRDLRYRFLEVERVLRRGGTVEITRRGIAIGRLVPVVPDVLARLRSLYGGRMLRESGAAVLGRERDRY